MYIPVSTFCAVFPELTRKILFQSLYVPASIYLLQFARNEQPKAHSRRQVEDREREVEFCMLISIKIKETLYLQTGWILYNKSQRFTGQEGEKILWYSGAVFRERYLKGGSLGMLFTIRRFARHRAGFRSRSRRLGGDVILKVIQIPEHYSRGIFSAAEWPETPIVFKIHCDVGHPVNVDSP